MNTITAFTARHRYARITARKARIIADVIRGRNANEALELMQFTPQRAAAFYLKVLKSAMANASQDEGVNLNALVVVDCRADDGPMLNNRLRWRPGPQGRAMPWAKKTSHLTVTVAEPIAEDQVEPAVETPAKPAAKQPAPPAAEDPAPPVAEDPVEPPAETPEGGKD